MSRNARAGTRRAPARAPPALAIQARDEGPAAGGSLRGAGRSLVVMAGRVRIGANLAAPVAPSSWWAKHVPGEGRGAHHPRLSLVSTPPGVDAGPEPVPGLVPGARHDVAATTVPPARYVSAYAARPGHLSR